MKPARRLAAPVAIAAMLTSAGPTAASADPPAPVATTVTATALYYALPDQPDFTVGVAAVDHGPWRLEARYNYEAKSSTSLLAGRRFEGGDELTYAITPIAGPVAGKLNGVVAGFEGSLGWRALDVYIEAEYVNDVNTADDAYWYAWTELGWRPMEGLRLGLVGQRTRLVGDGLDLQRGVFVQGTWGSVTLGLFAFNPESGDRYLVVSLGASF